VASLIQVLAHHWHLRWMSRFDDLAETLVDGRNYSFASWWVCVWRTQRTDLAQECWWSWWDGDTMREACRVMLLFYFVVFFKFCDTLIVSFRLKFLPGRQREHIVWLCDCALATYLLFRHARVTGASQILRVSAAHTCTAELVLPYAIARGVGTFWLLWSRLAD
jgi:hypothetical protein